MFSIEASLLPPSFPAPLLCCLHGLQRPVLEAADRIVVDFCLSVDELNHNTLASGVVHSSVKTGHHVQLRNIDADHLYTGKSLLYFVHRGKVSQEPVTEISDRKPIAVFGFLIFAPGIECFSIINTLPMAIRRRSELK